ncbi:GntR family transcriptional regulator [Pseudooceanicola aestuarii]|uniref:GntR family transcriptional regulator n=1 Tax=Pseudooceanicola aestuarii TaxID=2697319 RepID=UPI0013D3B6A6|nr:GntR family transcriptional regulator [Pseudooceanicola aestuarii]
MSKPPAQPGKRESLRGQAYEALKKRILSCDLKPGEAVTVAALAQDMGLGRTPVIQAVDRLMLDGLVEVMPRKGVVVSPVSLEVLIEIIEVRLLNECRAARWASQRITDKQVKALRNNVKAMQKAAAAREVEQLISLDSAFHKLISEAAGNDILAELLENLHDRSLRFWTLSLQVPEHNDRVVDQHSKIVEALANRDADASEEAVREHIAAFQSNIVDRVMRR